MSRAWLLGICTVLLLASCQTEDLKTETEKKTLTQIEPSAGYEIYKQQSCITCHGDNLEGSNGPKLIENSWSAEEINEIISNGIGFMPPQEMDEDDQTILAEWLSEQ